MTSNNNRGQFRGMKMADLQKSADHPTWLISESSKYIYKLPVALSQDEARVAGKNLSAGIPAEQIRQVGVYTTATSPHSHIGPFLHAIDFLVPDGTEVLAALDGEIIEVVQGNTEWGDGSEYRDKLNFLTIKHFDYKIGKVEDDVLIIDADKTKLLKNVTSYSEFIELIGTDCLTKNEELVCQFTQQEKFPQVFVEGRKKELRAFYAILGRYFEIK